MSIVIFGDLFTFPEGNAATNRVHTYAKGFLEQGVNVHVVCFLNNYSDNKEGIWEGIHFHYPFPSTRRSKSFFGRRWAQMRKYTRTRKLLKQINRKDKIIAINSWTNNLSVHVFAWNLSRLVRAKLIPEISEHPMRAYQGSKARSRRGIRKLKFEMRLADGVFCISRYLINFYQDHGVPAGKLFLVPSTVDPSRFATRTQKPISDLYIGYFGSLSFKRDNVDALIRAFAAIASKHPDYQLVLGGFAPENEKKNIPELIRELGLGSRIRVLGYLSREEIMQYIVHADLLVMTRRNDLAGQASYPSKLTEFLATGKPVLTMNVGEITDFLEDGVNAYLVEPENPVALAEKLDYILNNYKCAIEVGLKGKELTSGIFNYSFQAKRMLGYIESLDKKN